MNRILLLLLLFPVLAFAQTSGFIKPDYAEIEKAIANKESAYYYPPLLKRYKANDTTLTKDEYKYLYYGKHFYNDPSDKVKEDTIAENRLRAINKKDTLSTAEHQERIALYKKKLEQHPFSMANMNQIYASARQINDSANAKIYMHKLRKLVAVIMSTGDGMTDQTGLHVVAVPDEYFMLRVLGFTFGGSQTLTKNPCDYLTVKSNKDNVEGVYFDVTQMMASLKKTLMGEGVGKDFLKMLEDEDAKSKGKKKK